MLEPTSSDGDDPARKFQPIPPIKQVLWGKFFCTFVKSTFTCVDHMCTVRVCEPWEREFDCLIFGKVIRWETNGRGLLTRENFCTSTPTQPVALHKHEWGCYSRSSRLKRVAGCKDENVYGDWDREMLIFPPRIDPDVNHVHRGETVGSSERWTYFCNFSGNNLII